MRNISIIIIIFNVCPTPSNHNNFACSHVPNVMANTMAINTYSQHQSLILLFFTSAELFSYGATSKKSGSFGWCYQFLSLLPFDVEATKTCKNAKKLFNLCVLPLSRFCKRGCQADFLYNTKIQDPKI